jgi:FkbM family methyltransferase
MKYAQGNIDKTVLQTIPQPGIFVDAGGSHPQEQSNTFLLEQNGWRGVAIEPSPRYNKEYESLRPNTVLVNCALVGQEYQGETIEGDFRHMVGGCTSSHKKIQTVEAKTLSSILSAHGIKHVDFLSLDVEGYEHEVLRGVSFNSVVIDLMCVEQHKVPDYGNFKYMDELGYENVHQTYSDNGSPWHLWFVRKESGIKFNLC